MLGRHAERLLIHGAACFALLLATSVSCSSGPRDDDDDDDAGESGAAGASDGQGGTSDGGTGGGTGGDGTGGTSADGGTSGSSGASGSAGNASSTGGTGDAGGDGSGGTGGDTSGTGGSGTGGSSSGGSAGECAGDDCPCTGDACPVTVCGDGKLEGNEGCDDSNALPFDGCSPSCELEPDCMGAACESVCGDGIVAGEDCDDGNANDGDGCSKTCEVEDGYTCTAASCEEVDGRCALRLPVLFRDFNARTAAGGHPDFQPGYASDGAYQGLVEELLDVDGKPVQTSVATEAHGYMHGQAAFAQWYRNAAPASAPIPGELVLFDDGAGDFVNRWGPNGEPWIGYPDAFTSYTYCVDGCATCGEPGPGQVCLDACTPLSLSATYACILNQTQYDGNPTFFPLDSSPGILNETRGKGKVPEQYGWAGWPWETDVALALGIATTVETATAPFPSTTHNFSFTTEVKFWFRYDSTKTQVLSFLGDDDVWVFINGHLAVDLGGWHVPLGSTVTLADGNVEVVTALTATGTPVTKTGTASAFGLEDGKVYQIAVFHAERQSEGSSFKLGLRGLDVTRSSCSKN